MKIIKRQDRVEHANSPKCIAYEYPMGDKDINVAFVKINGRYPDRGRVVNQRVKELVYVTGGKGMIVIEGKKYGLEEGDAVLLLPGEKYFFDGKLKIVTPCNPAWYPEQHKEVD